MRWLALFAIAAIGLILPRGFDAPESANACGSAGPFDFDTIEFENYHTAYNQLIELAAAGYAAPATGSLPGGEEPYDLRYQGLHSGPRSARVTTPNPALGIPPVILKSIAWVESSWANASSSVPYGGVGPTIRSFDCGYGLGQITTGMGNSTGTATTKQAIIGTHPLFNLAEGARILADKWNGAPRFRPVAGNGDPAILEDWYYAIWSYNGFAFSNHPLNPNRDPLRGGKLPVTDPGPTPTPTATPSVTPSVTGTPTATPTPSPTPLPFAGLYSPIYHCYDKSAPSFQDVGGGQPKFGYGDYTYSERVYGCIKYPPKRAPAGQPASAAVRLWPAQDVNMPDFTVPAVAAAFAPQHFLDCESDGFSGGCPKMDFPTTLANKPPPHRDTTVPIDAAVRASFAAAPSLTVTGARSIDISVDATGKATGGTVVAENVGTGIAPFRIRASEPWVIVRHPDDPAGRTLDGSIAVGADIEVVTQQSTAGPPSKPRQAVAGYKSQLLITVGAGAPVGSSTAKVYLEPLSGNGEVVVISLAVTKAQGGTGTPAPVGTPTADTRPYKAYVPDAKSDGPLH